jgi:hypothetical protein
MIYHKDRLNLDQIIPAEYRSQRSFNVKDILELSNKTKRINYFHLRYKKFKEEQTQNTTRDATSKFNPETTGGFSTSLFPSRHMTAIKSRRKPQNPMSPTARAPSTHSSKMHKTTPQFFKPTPTLNNSNPPTPRKPHPSPPKFMPKSRLAAHKIQIQDYSRDTSNL